MLILTRKVGESFLVGDDIEIIVTDIKKGSVRIGVEAPRNMAVYRKEIYARILQENEVAARVNVESSQLEELDYLINQHIKG